MLRRRFGNSSLEVSAISIGCWIVGVDWWGHYTDEAGVNLFQYAYDQGITFFDNGDAYGNGRAETVFAKFVKQVGRDKIEIGSKFGYDFYSDPGEEGSHRERKQDFSPAFMRRSLEKSLQRMQIDVIDLYMAHNIKLPQFRDDIFAELGKLRDEGKIREWGVSLGPAIGWRDEGFRAMLDHDAKAVQTVYNLFEQSPGREFGDTARTTQSGILARVHDNSGILKGRMSNQTIIGNNDHRKFRDQSWKVFGLRKLEQVLPFAERQGDHIHTYACRWLLSDPNVTSITATLLNEEEIREVAEAGRRGPLPAADLVELQRLYDADFNLGDDAHPCDLKSSSEPSGKTRSGYVPPPVMIA